MIQKFASAILLSVLFSCHQKETANSKDVILFVCEHGAARSPIAAAYFNKLAEEQGLNYTAVFRGTDPNDALTQGTAKGLKADGMDINDWIPVKVSENDIKEAYRVVTFDLILPTAGNDSLGFEQWNGTPAISEDYGTARDMIVDLVNQLISTLKTTKQQ